MTCASISLAAPLWTEGVGCTACQSPTIYYDKYSDECVADCPLTAPVKSEDNVCTKCAEIDPKKALWDPMIESCVRECITEIRYDIPLVCKTCAEKNELFPLRVDDTCISCFSYAQSRPKWDKQT